MSTLELSAQTYHMVLDFIRPGYPEQNAYIERFKRTCREDVLDTCLFSSLREMQQLTRVWIQS